MPPVASTSCAALLLNEEGAPPTHHSPPRASPVRVLAAPIINNHTSNNKFRFADPARRSVTPILPVAQPSPRPPPVPSPVPAPAAPKAVSPAKKVDLKGKGKATDEPTTSLLRRLAGPSDQKAGLQRDKEEVKRIIYDVSKGSKYFQAQEKSDAILTVKVDKLLARLEQRVREKGGDLRAEEASVDAMLAEMEKTRNTNETIVVVDADAFYASCHQREDPSLVGKAFGVGKGVLTTASYEARKYGVSSAMAGFVAKALCPELIFLDLDFELYTSCSKSIMKILGEYGDMSKASLDEAYISLTDYCKREGVTPAVAAERMRAQVLAETGLTVSAGVSPNSMLSKVAADKKKPNGQFVIAPTREACMEFSSSLRIRQIPGIGRVSERILQAVGVNEVKDVYRLRGKLALIRHEIGLSFLLRAYLGLGGTQIKQHDRSERKTIGVERTFHPLSDVQVFHSKLKKIADALAEDCKKLQYTGRTVNLVLKYDNYERINRSKTLGSSVFFNDAATMYSEGIKLLSAALDQRRKAKGGGDPCVRLLGLRMSNLRDEKAHKGAGQLDGWATSGKANGKRSKATLKSKSKAPRGRDKALAGSASPPPLSKGFKIEEDGSLVISDDEDDDGEHALVKEEVDVLASFSEDERDHDDDTTDVKPSKALRPPASSDPLWAAFDDAQDLFAGLDDFDDPMAQGGSGGEGDAHDYDSTDSGPIETTHKPQFTGGPSINSKKEPKDVRVAPQDRFSFDRSNAGRSKVEKEALKTEMEEEEEGEGEGGGARRGAGNMVECPVCQRQLVGSEVALAAHVATHFDDNAPPKKKFRPAGSATAAKGKSGGGKKTSDKPKQKTMMDHFKR